MVIYFTFEYQFRRMKTSMWFVIVCIIIFVLNESLGEPQARTTVFITHFVIVRRCRNDIVLSGNNNTVAVEGNLHACYRYQNTHTQRERHIEQKTNLQRPPEGLILSLELQKRTEIHEDAQAEQAMDLYQCVQKMDIMYAKTGEFQITWHNLRFRRWKRCSEMFWSRKRGNVPQAIISWFRIAHMNTTEFEALTTCSMKTTCFVSPIFSWSRENDVRRSHALSP